MVIEEWTSIILNPIIELSHYNSLRVSAGLKNVVHLAKRHFHRLLADQVFKESLIFTPRTLIFHQ